MHKFNISKFHYPPHNGFVFKTVYRLHFFPTAFATFLDLAGNVNILDCLIFSLMTKHCLLITESLIFFFYD